MASKRSIVALFAALFIVLGCAAAPSPTAAPPTSTLVPPAPAAAPPTPTATPQPPTPTPSVLPEGFKELKIDSNKFLVEVADTPEKQAKGLGERDNLPNSRGMLFPFASEAYYALWMKGMRFPLDFVWISADKRIVDMAYNVPAEPGKTDRELSIYSPKQPCLYILEINSGLALEYRFQIGDSVEF